MSGEEDLPPQAPSPQIPEDALDKIQDEDLRSLLEPIVQQLQIYQGTRGNALDRPPTRRELWRAGVINIVDGDGVVYSYDPDPDEPTPTDSPTNPIVPPATPTGLSTYPTPNFIFLEWDRPDYDGHAHTEVWVSASNDLSTATSAGKAPFNQNNFGHNVGSSGQTRYFWIRFVNKRGRIGAWNAGSSSGTAGTTGTASTTDGYIGLDGAKIIHASIVEANIGDLAVSNAKIANATIEGGKIAADTITADKYNELRNTYVINGEDSLDNTYPFTYPFRIVSETTSIESVLLSFRIVNFRAYTQTGSSSSGGETVGSTTENVGHSHDVITGGATSGTVLYAGGGGGFWYHQNGALGTIAVDLSTVESHLHQVTNVQYTATPVAPNWGQIYESSGTLRQTGGVNKTTSTSNGHTHDITVNSGSSGNTIYITGSSPYILECSGNPAVLTSEVVDQGTHNHDVTTNNHTHNNVFGIYEESNSPTITVWYDNAYATSWTQFGSNYTTDQQELDLTSSFSGTGWKAIEFRSTTRCRILFHLQVKIDLSA